MDYVVLAVFVAACFLSYRVALNIRLIREVEQEHIIFRAKCVALMAKVDKLKSGE
jgi:hypothetical protein